MRQEQFLVGVLLHDLGKVIERSGEYQLPEDLKSVNQPSHSKYSALLIRIIKDKTVNNDYLKSILDDEVEALVLNHHNPKTIEELILQISDWISAPEMDKDDKGGYSSVPLISIFSRIGEVKKEFAYKLEKLSYSTLMPLEKEVVTVNQNSYKRLLEDFFDALKYVDNYDKLLNLFEIYFSSVPVQTSGYMSDISIYDYSRTTVAIANALYIDYLQGILDKDRIDKIRNWMTERKGDTGEEKIFSVLEGDLSGIQNFIFSIPSKKAARSLKGRSVYLSLLARYAADYIIRETGLTPASILYLGGGNFQILLPMSERRKIEEIREYISSIIWEIHKGDIALNIDWYEASLEEMFSFEKVKDRLSEKIAIKKLQKFKEIEDMYEKIFLPEDEVIYEGEPCVVCGRKSKHTYEEQKLCPVCNSLVELTDSLKDARFLMEFKCEKTEDRSSIHDFFMALGYDIRFSRELTRADKIFALNDFEPLKDGYLLDGFLLGSFNLPDKEFEEIGDASSIEIDETTKLGDNKLAYLKMDVDNLGRIFSGLSAPEKGHRGVSLSRIRTLSNRLDLFFSGYTVNYLREFDKSGEYLYPVFVGGDDLFIIGSWNRVIELAQDIRERFREYTGRNPLFTISAGVSFFRSDYPVIRASRDVEEELDRAKKFVYREEEKPSKDKVCTLGETLQWKEYDVAIRLRRQITDKTRDREPRSVIFKIEKAVKGFKPVLELSLAGKMKAPSVWRLSYYLRDYKEIADVLEKIILENLFEKEKIRNPMIIAVASKLSEMDTRKITQEVKK